MKICPNESCKLYNTRYSTYKFCNYCGTKLIGVVQCCEDESLIHDEGFCTSCGKKKEIKHTEDES